MMSQPNTDNKVMKKKFNSRTVYIELKRTITKMGKKKSLE